MKDIPADFDTEREHALRLSLYLHSNDAIMFLEPPEWRFIAGNPSALKMFMMREESALTSADFWKLSPERQPDGSLSSVKAKEMIALAMRDGAHFFEWTHCRSNGEDFPASVLLVKVDLEGAPILQATVKDLSGEKRAQQKLASVEQKHRSIVEFSADQMFILDSGGNILFVNNATANVFGQLPETHIGKPLSNVFPREMAVKLSACAQRVVETGQPEIFEEMVDGLGRNFLMSARLTPTKDNAGAVTGIVGIIRDIRQKGKIENILQLARVKNKLNSLLARYVDALMLGVVAGATVIANEEDDKESTVHRKEAVVEIKKNAARLGEALNFMHKLAQEDLEIDPMELPRVNLREVVEMKVEVLSAELYSRSQIVKVVEESGVVPLVTVDREMVKQVVLNLLSNASQYSSENATIIVSIAAKDGHVEVSVKDNGIGIPKEEYSKVYERFFRGRNTTDFQLANGGLGLALTKSLVELWGGKIWFESEENKGTTFYFTIPTMGS